MTRRDGDREPISLNTSRGVLCQVIMYILIRGWLASVVVRSSRCVPEVLSSIPTLVTKVLFPFRVKRVTES